MKSINYGSIFCFFFVFALPIAINAQQDSLVGNTESYFILNSGIAYAGFPIGELAFGHISKDSDADTKLFYMQLSNIVGTEFWLKDDKTIFAFKYAFNLGLNEYLPIPVNTGASFLYVTEFSDKSFCIRLEYGIPINNGRLYYGYVIPVYNKDFVKGYRHQIAFSWAFRISKKRKYETFYNKEMDEYIFKDYE